jgi:hypothetical protein
LIGLIGDAHQRALRAALRIAASNLATECSIGLNSRRGTLVEQAALALPNSVGLLGTVRRLFRRREAESLARETAENNTFSWSFSGAGEGIRILDPDLGKVVVLFQLVGKAH